MDGRDERIVSAAADYVWNEMTLMRQYGFTNLEGNLRVKDGELHAEVKGIDPRPAEFITLTFNVEARDG